MPQSRTLFASILLFVLASTAAAAPRTAPEPPDVAGTAHLLIDHHSGRVLAAKSPDERVEPASLTKIMSAYALFSELEEGNISLDDEVRISEKAWRMKGSRMFLEVNSTVTVEELLMGMIVQSGNDASVALAEHTAGSEDAFVALMNHHAAELGMNGTQFRNSTGMPAADHYTTANDLAKLVRAMIRRFPEYYTWYKEREYTHNDIRQFNRNRLLWLDANVDGVKTGHTESAGYCLVSSAEQEEMRLIAIVVGTGSDNERVEANRSLLNYGFRFFETMKLYSAGEPVSEPRIWKGARETLPLGLERDLYVTLPRGERSKVSASMSVDSSIVAPALAGQEFGTVDVKYGDEELASLPLVALEAVDEGGLMTRLLDNVKLLFQ